MGLYVLKQLWENTSLIVKLLGAGSTLTGALVVMAVIRRRKQNKPRKQYPSNTVVFYHTGRSFHVPCLPPFAVKLETYLRMAKIPYIDEVSRKQGPKGKWPWIEYNNEQLGDSEFCIEYLNKIKGVNPNSHLTPEESAIGRAFQKMIEENTYWVIALDRFVFDETREVATFFNMPKWLVKVVGNRLMKQAQAQGIGRHTKEEIYGIMRTDLDALSNFIGEKKFLFGDRACQFDCAIFGQLSQCRWEGFGGQVTNIIEEFPNLCQYCDNMKNEFWPDWDECTREGQKKLRNTT